MNTLFVSSGNFKWRVSDHNGTSLLYIIVEIYHSGRKPSKYTYILLMCDCFSSFKQTYSLFKTFLQQFQVCMFLICHFPTAVSSVHVPYLSLSYSSFKCACSLSVTPTAVSSVPVPYLITVIPTAVSSVPVPYL